MFHHDDDIGDGPPHRPPPHVDDRLWRHPAEWADLPGASVPGPRPRRRGVVVGAVTGVCLVGVVVTAGLLWLQQNPGGPGPSGTESALGTSDGPGAERARSAVTPAEPADAITRRDAWLGVQIGNHHGPAPSTDTTRPPMIVSIVGPRQGGAIVTEVSADGPAHRAGIEAGDVIVALDDTPVRQASDLVDAVDGHAPGVRVVIELERRGEPHLISVSLGHQPDP